MLDNQSLASSIASDANAQAEFLASLSDDEAIALQYEWGFWARPSQELPPDDALTDREWFTWLVLAGRGFGKTRMGAEFVRYHVENGLAGRIALVANDAKDGRDVMIEGESGIMAISPPWFRPIYQPSKRRLTWPNGAVATLYSAEEPESLRGPQQDLAWSDEICKWQYAIDAWDNLQLGLRLGINPRQIVTTTPKPQKLLKDIIADRGTVITRGSTYDNIGNLAPAFIARVVRKYEGTRLGRQELRAEVLDDNPDALWHLTNIDANRLRLGPLRGFASFGNHLPDSLEIVRIVVAIDPPVTSGEDADECGILVCAVDRQGHGYVLEDASAQGLSPLEWARIAVWKYFQWGADRIVAEVNNGGELVETVIRAVNDLVAYRAVHASRGKVTRAEPVSALYEQNLIHHMGSFAALEDQMCEFTNDFDKDKMGYSPDRVDGLVWAFTDLMLSANDGIIQHYRNEFVEAQRKKAAEDAERRAS